MRFVEFALSLAFLAPGLDELAVLGKLHDARIGLLAVTVGDPDIPVIVDAYAVRADKHLGAECDHHLARCVIFGDRIDVRVLTGVAAAAVEHPEALAVLIERQAGRRSEIAAHAVLGPALVQTTG